MSDVGDLTILPVSENLAILGVKIAGLSGRFL